MPHLSPTTLTTDEQHLILRVTSKHPRDHLIISMALGTGLRLGAYPSVGSSSRGGPGNSGRGSIGIGCTRCTRCGTRP